MSSHIQPESNLAEIMAGKQKRRDELLHAIRLAKPADLEAAVQRIKEVMIRYLANVKYLCYEIQTFRNSGVLRPLNVPSSA